MSDEALRDHLARILDWEEAHVGFDKAIADLPAEKRGARAPGFEHSVWELVEHMRIAQEDILDFCVNPKYVHTMKWPDDYWPKAPAPPTARAWNASVAAFRKDRRALKRLAANPRLDLSARIPHGDGQTYIREILLALDHNAYHVGELIVLRRLLGAWK